MQTILIFLSLTVALLGTGCSAHRIDIQQGNAVSQDKVDMLKLGMDQRQVRFILGTPLLEDPFHQGRWDYFYSFRPGDGTATGYRLTLYFEKERLARVEKSGTLPATERDTLIKPGEQSPETD